jgi:large subunit ribosomal protein L21
MENYAVFKIKGKQYKVKRGDEILVPGECDEKVKTEVLLLLKDGKVFVGKPLLTRRSVKLKIVEEKVKGEKVEVLKFRAKSRYRKKIGFRSISTKYLVEKID